MSDEQKIRDHCEKQITARVRWAVSLTPESHSKNSEVSKNMIHDALSKPIEEQVEAYYRYWRMRAGIDSSNPDNPRFRYDRAQWDAVVAGSPIEGNYSFWGNEHPEAETTANLNM